MNTEEAIPRCVICGEETTHNRESSWFGEVHRFGPTDHPFTSDNCEPYATSKLASWVRDNLIRRPHLSSPKQQLVRYQGKGVALLSPEEDRWRIELLSKDDDGCAYGELLGYAANLDCAMKFVGSQVNPSLPR